MSQLDSRVDSAIDSRFQKFLDDKVAKKVSIFNNNNNNEH